MLFRVHTAFKLSALSIKQIYEAVQRRLYGKATQRSKMVF